MIIDARRFLILLFAAALLAGCGGTGEEADDDDSNALAAPDFTVTMLNGDGESVSLSDYKGKLLILDFWATWCGPCKREIPHFNDLYARYQDKGLAILGVSLDQGGPDVVDRFMKSTPIQYESAMAPPEMQAAYGPIKAIPTTFVIDKKGRVQRRFVGYQDISVFEEVIAELL